MKKFETTLTGFGFKWGDCSVERTASNNTKPKFQILTVTAPNGDRIEIIMRPRSTKIAQFYKDGK